MFFLVPATAFPQFRTIPVEKENLSKTEKDSLEGANALVKEERFERAIPVYRALLRKNPGHDHMRYRLGICYQISGETTDRSLSLLRGVVEAHPKVTQAKIHLSRTLLLAEKYDSALTVIGECLDEGLSYEKEKRVERLSRNAEHAKAMSKDPRQIVIKNIGPKVNSPWNEYAPVISLEGKTLLFTYRGELSVGGRQNYSHEEDPFGIFFEDVYQTRLKEGKWTDPTPLEEVNTKTHDASVGLSSDGRTLLVYRNTRKDIGDIYVSERKGKKWGAPEKIPGAINTDNNWEGGASISADGKTLYFSSERTSGEGGKDIYKASLLSDGKWGDVENLGPVVNSEYDDDTPFIHPNGRTLYFSSKGHGTMGGYDIFRTDKKGEAWSKPQNAGMPLNSPRDEKQYVVTADGKKGYYSSSKVGGEGKQDIYLVQPGNFGKEPHLIMVEGHIKDEGDPLKIKCMVREKNTGEEILHVFSNPESGHFMVVLPSGLDYSIEFSREGETGRVVREIRGTGVEEYKEVHLNIDLSEE